MRVSGKGMDRAGAAFLGDYLKKGTDGWEIDTGLLGPRQAGGRRPPFDLGRLGKYCR
jgi:hypothetical protein